MNLSPPPPPPPFSSQPQREQQQNAAGYPPFKRNGQDAQHHQWAQAGPGPSSIPSSEHNQDSEQKRTGPLPRLGPSFTQESRLQQQQQQQHTPSYGHHQVPLNFRYDRDGSGSLHHGNHSQTHDSHCYPQPEPCMMPFMHPSATQHGPGIWRPLEQELQLQQGKISTSSAREVDHRIPSQSMPPPPPPHRPSNPVRNSLLSIAVPGPRTQPQQQDETQNQHQPGLSLSIPPHQQRMLAHAFQQLQSTFPAQSLPQFHPPSGVPNQGPPSSSSQIPPPSTPADPLYITIAALLKSLHNGLQSVLNETSSHMVQAMVKMHDDYVKLASKERQKARDLENVLAAERGAWERSRIDMQLEMDKLRMREERLRSDSVAHHAVVRDGIQKHHAAQDEAGMLRRENEELKSRLAKLGKIVETICYEDSSVGKDVATRNQGPTEDEKFAVASVSTSNPSTSSYSQTNGYTNTSNQSDIEIPPPSTSSSSTYTTPPNSRSVSSTPVPASAPASAPAIPHSAPQLAAHPQPHTHRRHSAPVPIPAPESTQTIAQLRPQSDSRRSYANSIMASPESRSVSPAFVHRQVDEEASAGGSRVEANIRNLNISKRVSTSVASEVEVIDLCSSPMSMAVDLRDGEEAEDVEHPDGQGRVMDEAPSRSRSPSPPELPRTAEDEASIGDHNQMDIEIGDDRTQHSEMEVNVKLESEVEVKLEHDDVQIDASVSQNENTSRRGYDNHVSYHFNAPTYPRNPNRRSSPFLPPLLSLPTPAAGSVPSPSPSSSRSPSPAPASTLMTRPRDSLPTANPTPPPTPTLTPSMSPFSSRKRSRADYEHGECHEESQGPSTRVKVERIEGEEMMMAVDDRPTMANIVTSSLTNAPSATLQTSQATTDNLDAPSSGSTSSPQACPAIESSSKLSTSRVSTGSVHSLNDGPSSLDVQSPPTQHGNSSNNNPVASRPLSASSNTTSGSGQTQASSSANVFPSPPRETPVPPTASISALKLRCKEEGEITPTTTPTATPTPAPLLISQPIHISPSKEEGEVSPTPSPAPAPTPATPATVPPRMVKDRRVTSASSAVPIPVAFASPRRHTIPASVHSSANMGGMDEAWDVRPAHTPVLLNALSSRGATVHGDAQKGKEGVVIESVPTKSQPSISNGTDIQNGRESSTAASVATSRPIAALTPGLIPVGTNVGEEREVTNASSHQNISVQSQTPQARAENSQMILAPSSSKSAAADARNHHNALATTDANKKVDPKAAAVAIGVAIADAIRHPDAKPNPVLNTILNALPLRPPVAVSNSQTVHVTPSTRSNTDSTPAGTAVPIRPPPLPTQSKQFQPSPQASSAPPHPAPSARNSAPNPRTTACPPLVPNSTSHARPGQKAPSSAAFHTMFRSKPHPQPTRPTANLHPNANLPPRPQMQSQPNRSQVQNMHPPPPPKADARTGNPSQVDGHSHNRQHPQQRVQSQPHLNTQSQPQQQNNSQRPPQQHKMGINHMELLYNRTDKCWTCRICLAGRQKELTSPSDSSSTPKPVVKFSIDAPWAELVGHCYNEHPVESQKLERLTPAQVAEMKQRMHLPQSNPGPSHKGNGAR
ncbi:hypothetical protein JR316_0005399 [Psilocybe cubensis]|uniref:Uncharacterized protein n=2 Tax=Psilocybe cubensis TaxID=181762 RepID=A0A8H8CEW0_PSICU|nr:hypothetical protein JR316_0005399 [Psilocybe cubensis]KAH9483293.1 hypothetical protein JR316_0005399 [Psilocybe cubensis]